MQEGGNVVADDAIRSGNASPSPAVGNGTGVEGAKRAGGDPPQREQIKCLRNQRRQRSYKRTVGGEPTPSTPSDDDRTVGEDHSDEIMKRNGVPSPQIDADRRSRCGRSSKRHTRRRDAEETLSTMKPNRGRGQRQTRRHEIKWGSTANGGRRTSRKKRSSDI